MTPKAFEKKVNELVSQFDEKDAYFLVHFSGSKDAFSGFHDGLDKLDAIIIMKQLFEYFEMTEDDLQTFHLITNGK